MKKKKRKKERKKERRKINNNNNKFVFLFEIKSAKEKWNRMTRAKK